MPGKREPPAWFGSLVGGNRDQSGLRYRRTRYYDPATGQFTQQDPIGIAGGLNLYGFAGGDPVNFSDPFGLCPEESEDGAVCLDFFIQAATVLFWKGDGRDFDANASPDQSRVQIVANGNGILFKSNSDSCRTSGGCTPSSLEVTFTVGENGSFTISVTATNNSKLGGFIPNPSINASVTFTPYGVGGYTTAGNRDAMPSLGIYQRQNGAWSKLQERGERGGVFRFPPAPNDKWNR